MPSPRFPYALELERALGDPRDAASPISFARAVELDEREEFPAEFTAVLRQQRAHLYLIPAALGGALETFEESMLALRLIARRDLTTAIAFGQTFLGSIPIWLAGNSAQQQQHAERIRQGALCSLALTERDHGGDLLACEFTATPTAGGYRLSGEKWLINNGSQGGALTVFARTSAEPGPAAFSLVLVDRTTAPPHQLAALPKVRTLGIRGADISGFACRDLPLDASALVGAAGQGYQITLKTLQISRTLCAALSLGAADTALRAALHFARSRHVFGDTVSAIPSARDQLAGAYADLLIAEALALVSARAMQAGLERMSLWSAIVKSMVPLLVEDLIRRSAAVLGARHYLREAHYDGIFQKAQRDNAVVGLFDGSTAVNLGVISGQLGALKNRRGLPDPQRPARLEQLFALSVPLQNRAFPRDSDMKFTADGRDEIVEGLLEARGHLGTLDPLATELAEELQVLDHRLESLQKAKDQRTNSSARFALAERYGIIHAASAAILLWRHNRANDEVPESLLLGVHRLLERLRPGRAPAPEEWNLRTYAQLESQFVANELFSRLTLPLGVGAGVR